MTNVPTDEGAAAGDAEKQPDRKKPPFVQRNAAVLGVAVLVAIGATLGTDLANWARDAVLGDRGNSLSAVVQWPTLRSCDGATIVAMPAGGLPIDELEVETNQDDARLVATEAGAGAYVSGNLTILLTTQDPSPSYVTDVRAVVFASKPTDLDWILDVEGGCGDVYEREFILDLASDSPSVIDAGLVGGDSVFPEDEDTFEDPAVRADPLGPAFSIEDGEAARLLVRVRSRCGHEVEWGLIVDYVHEESVESLHVGSPEDPFRSVEGPGPRYVFEGGFDGSPREPALREANFESWACG